MDEVFRKTVQFYDDYADAFEERTRQKSKRQWIDAFLALLPSRGVVLDAGCAYGRDARVFVDLGLRVVGIDGSRVMIGRARQLVPEAEFAVADIRHLPFAASSFDGIWAANVLVHVPRGAMLATLRGLHTCLKDDGILFLSMYVGNGEGMESDERYAGAEKFYAYVSVDEARGMLTNAGFALLQYTTRASEHAIMLECLANKI